MKLKVSALFVARALSCLTSLLLVVLGVFIAMHFEANSFGLYCHLLAELLLLFVAGLYGLWTEGRALAGKLGERESSTSSSPFVRALMSRLGVGLLYLWVGLYVMGGYNYITQALEILGTCVGALSWAAAIANVFAACREGQLASDRADRKAMYKAEKERKAQAAAEARDQTVGSPDDDPHNYFSPAVDAQNENDLEANTEAPDSVPPRREDYANPLGEKPFGCA